MKNLLNNPAAMIFDMDGTLLDTEPLYSDATQKLLDPFNVEYTLELKQRCIGGDSRTSAQIVIDHFDLPMTPTEYLDARAVHLEELFRSAPEMPGAGQFIHSLEQKSLKVGLATSSHHHLMDTKMTGRSWANGFDAVVCGDDPELEKGKPAPDIFLLCAKRLGVDPSRCIAFEDSPNGVNAALAAGMQVVAIESPYVDPAKLEGAAAHIKHYEELEQFVAELVA